MSLARANEKFSSAVRTLATDPADIKGRLAHALVSHISSVEMEQDVPEGLHDEYQAFWERVTSGSPISSEGRLQASVREMDVDEAVETAHLIVRFASEFRHRLAEQRRT